MKISFVLAHGNLGGFDELIMLGIAGIFLIMMGVSWLKSRSMEPISDDENEQKDNEQNAPSNKNGDETPLDHMK